MSTPDGSDGAEPAIAGQAKTTDTLTRSLTELLESEAPGDGLHIRRGGRAVTLRRTNKGHMALWVCSLGQQPAITAVERDSLEQAGFRTVPGSRTDVWWRAPTNDLSPQTWQSAVEAADAAFLSGAEGELRWEHADLSTGCGTIVGIAALVAVWVGLTVAGVVFEVPGIYDAFQWMGGTTRPKTAGGLAAIITFFMVAIPAGLIAWLVGRLFPSPAPPS